MSRSAYIDQDRDQRDLTSLDDTMPHTLKPAVKTACITGDVSSQRLRAHVERLAGEIGERNVSRPEALRAAADYIEAEWHCQGYQVIPHWYDLSGTQWANLEVSRPGSARPGEILLIGAHYDSVMGSPGANDNASGVAALLELSRLFTDITPALTVRFVAFVNEEPPFFFTRRQGSVVYAKAARARGDVIRLMVSLETIGCYCDKTGSQRYPPLFRFFYPNRANFISFVSNFRSRALMRRAAEAFRQTSDFPLEHVATFFFIPGVAWSDHWSFWRQGYPAFMVTDTAFYRYPYYHTSQDTPEKLAYPELTRLTAGLAETFATLALGGLGSERD
ncbi:M28 family metallopeptidase [Candidatus Methylomirabilis sp.]|uniref:M28 family metallopeptidase n=1 Tax=Candidatus Methylomirabilis sp. TaxID=2032687 RepID=UPI002A6727C6|nr:M28 family metallopeptidase [Candidatus Methylomirabilis sp.]